MCTQKPPHDFSQQLYERYREAFNAYITSDVLPALREKQGEYMLKELVKRWDNHKIMVRWLSRFFNYLDRYYIQRHNLAQLKDVGMLCFRDLVYSELKKNVKDAVLALVDKERDGEQIDRALVKNILGIFVEMGMGGMEAYEQDFEAHLLTNTAAFYSRKASVWIDEDSCPDYLVKAEECLRREKERVGHYLHASSETKLLKEVEKEVLAAYETQLLEKEHSGCAVLLRDDKTEDLARMFRLFKRIPAGLPPVADIFKKHVEKEGVTLVKQAEDAEGAKKEAPKDKAAAAQGTEQVFVRSIIQLHDKYLQYVVDCFSNDSLFHRALKEAFEVFCNKVVTGSTSAELLACPKTLQDVSPLAAPVEFARGRSEQQGQRRRQRGDSSDDAGAPLHAAPAFQELQEHRGSSSSGCNGCGGCGGGSDGEGSGGRSSTNRVAETNARFRKAA